jgi:DNA-binding NarL/FixJ family response regulator
MKVLLIDDHRLFREGVALLLRQLMPEVELREASTCEEGFRLCDEHRDIELVLLDLNLHGLSGLAGLAILRERYPAIPVVVLSSAEDDVTIRATIDAGAMGFIPKSSSSDTMLDALRVVLANSIYLPPSLAMHEFSSIAAMSHPARRLPGHGPVTPLDLGLTSRQADVLYLVLQGKPIKLISRDLAVAESTVKSHVSSVLRALNVTTRTQAIVAAHRLGLRFDRPARSSKRAPAKG